MDWELSEYLPVVTIKNVYLLCCQMKDRIQKYIDYKNINAGEFAVMLEVQRSNISHILNGRNKPSAAFIEKMLLAFPDLNARWLLTGQGQMLETTTEAEQEADQATSPSQETIAFPRQETVSEVSAETSRSNNAQSVFPDIAGENVESVVLLFKDGTFASFKKR